MRIDVKTVKRRDYIQIADDEGYLHHVGPTTPKNFAICMYVLGEMESSRWLKWLMNYYEQKGIPKDFKQFKKEYPLLSFTDSIASLYSYGYEGLIPKDIFCASKNEIMENAEKLSQKIQAIKVLHQQVKQDCLEQGITYDLKKLRRYIKKRYDEMSEEEKEYYSRMFVDLPSEKILK